MLDDETESGFPPPPEDWAGLVISGVLIMLLAVFLLGGWVYGALRYGFAVDHAQTLRK